MLKPALIAATLVLTATLISGCASSPDRAAKTVTGSVAVTPSTVPGALPDRVAFLQTDPRWAKDRLGKSSDTMGSDGCLVTAVAMALTNLGYVVDPGTFNDRLTEAGGYTRNGWLIWSAVETVTDGRARAVYHDAVTPTLIRECMRAGQYPLVRFYLPNGRSHWAMIIAESAQGYRMRDPLRPSAKPLIFPRGADAFKSLRCVGAGPNAPRST